MNLQQRDWWTIVDPTAPILHLRCMYCARCTLQNACCCTLLVKLLPVAPVKVELLDAKSSLLKVSLQSLCWDMLGQYVCWVVVCVDFDQSHIVMWDQLLYVQVLQFDVFCFSWRSNPCCHTFAAWWICVDLDVDLVGVEKLRQKTSDVKCFCCSCVDGI